MTTRLHNKIVDAFRFAGFVLAVTAAIKAVDLVLVALR